MFNELSLINNLIDENEDEWRNKLIKFLWENFSCENQDTNYNYGIYSKLINHLIRKVWLYPYMDFSSSHWTDKMAYSSFSLDIKLPSMKNSNLILHREQSDVLKMLLEWENILLMAPTSFWKTFIINSFIKIKKPNNIVIIVPTISLMDEVRRNIYLNFSDDYNVITAPNEKLWDKNILVFPQERSFSYIEKFNEKSIKIDFLVIDEFYKVSPDSDKNRSSSLQKAIISFTKISNQRYYLTPSITKVKWNALIKWMKQVDKIGFNTVFLNVHDKYKNTKDKKWDFLKIMNKLWKSKTLIYAWTFKAINELSKIIPENIKEINNRLCLDFQEWLKNNYTREWDLISLLSKWFGIHNWKIHRSLWQIQIKLFEEADWLNGIISTSSIIEWVNTSAKNIIIWRAKNWNYNLNQFTYKNIIWRAWRMFKYFIWDIYVLDDSNKLKDNSIQLDLKINDDVLASIDTEEDEENDISKERRQKIIKQIYDIDDILWEWIYKKLVKDNKLQLSNYSDILKILKDMKEKQKSWNWFLHLNSEKYEDWEYFCRKLFFLMPWYREWIDIKDFLNYIKYSKDIWIKKNNEYIWELEEKWIDILNIFEIEKFVTYNFWAFLSDINILYNIFFNNNDNITPFISKVTSNFLPPFVFILEESWLPRVVSRKIQDSWFINLEITEWSIKNIIKELKSIWIRKIKSIKNLDNFDRYILDNFFDWI